MALKRFLVFAGTTYYPSGGASDYQYSADDLKEIKWPRDVYGDLYDWCNVLDTQSGSMIEVTKNA